MKYCFFFFFCLLYQVCVFAQESTTKEIDSIISWKPTVKLLWSDFQGEVNSGYFGKAKTSYKIEITPINVRVDEYDRIQNYERLTTEAQFYKKQSWTTIGANDTIVLTHERLHFDIAELFARKIRRKFDELKKKKDARFSSYSKEYSLLWKKCRKYQIQYDLETNHGRDLKQNEIWVNKIKEELRYLEEYN